MTNLRVMTCNIRVCTARDGDNAWDFRKHLCAEVIHRHAPDVIGFQEMRTEQWAFLRQRLEGYDWFGIARDSDAPHPLNAIFYRRQRFELVSPGGYFLSETPHVTGSVSWDSNQSRFANWVRLRERGGGDAPREVRVINTHLDHRGAEARPRQAQLINEDAQAFAEDYPQVLVGDFNDEPDTPAIQRVRDGGWRDTYQLVHGDAAPPHTMHDFQGAAYDRPHRKIDYIFVRGNITTHATQVVTDHDGPLYPSDHYFVLADLALPPVGADALPQAAGAGAGADASR